MADISEPQVTHFGQIYIPQIQLSIGLFNFAQPLCWEKKLYWQQLMYSYFESWPFWFQFTMIYPVNPFPLTKSPRPAPMVRIKSTIRSGRRSHFLPSLNCHQMKITCNNFPAFHLVDSLFNSSLRVKWNKTYYGEKVYNCGFSLVRLNNEFSSHYYDENIE